MSAWKCGEAPSRGGAPGVWPEGGGLPRGHLGFCTEATSLREVLRVLLVQSSPPDCNDHQETQAVKSLILEGVDVCASDSHSGKAAPATNGPLALSGHGL